jgi:formamidopyrimidine-DNA glycosylase
MPELPDIEVYLDALRPRIGGRRLERVRLNSPFLLRTVDPPLIAVEGRTVTELRRVGKRIAVGLEGGLWLVLHLMIAGRLHWKPPGAGLPGRRGLAAFDFAEGTLLLTEAGSERRASLHLAAGDAALASLDPGGVDILSASLDRFASALRAENHTLKRSLTDPRLFSGVGNAYSDEILHAAQLSPVALTSRLTDDEVERLWRACRDVLTGWVERLRVEAGGNFPEGVTAFRKEMAAHGRFGLPCPRCGAKVQRIRYASNETNYCAVCQTGGRLLADRALSRLLREDWPRTLEEREALTAAGSPARSARSPRPR